MFYFLNSVGTIDRTDIYILPYTSLCYVIMLLMQTTRLKIFWDLSVRYQTNFFAGGKYVESWGVKGGGIREGYSPGPQGQLEGQGNGR